LGETISGLVYLVPVIKFVQLRDDLEGNQAITKYNFLFLNAEDFLRVTFVKVEKF